LPDALSGCIEYSVGDSGGSDNSNNVRILKAFVRILKGF